MKEIEKNNNFETSEEYMKWYEKYSTEELVDLKKYFKIQITRQMELQQLKKN